ncbi:hypothetical protein FOZ63_020491 [Perkinsus olseni]|uniref:Uncharacterized protein n=1 Tax=Perkinsus olseni TaxID=32597 RepID=A0A7J6PS93_PEROL|nr:hypothetical protein FOZ63_020491 [Perkinsus olseni]
MPRRLIPLAKFNWILLLVSSLCVQSSTTSLAGKDYCHVGYGFIWGEEFRLSFVNSTHMTFSKVHFLRSSPQKVRLPSRLVTGIRYELDPGSGIIDTWAGAWGCGLFYCDVKLKDMRRIEYKELKDELTVKMRYKLFHGREARRFGRC